MFSAQFRELHRYPERRWAKAISDRWVSLCNGLRDYEAPCRYFAVTRERKWELVSAFQKSIRRADKAMALRLTSAMDSMPEEYAYFWRRLCVIACEDVGPADDVLASFVVACATVFPPRKTGNKNYDLFCFLAEQMCDLSTRSRIYCSYGAIEPAAKSELPELLVEDQSIVSAIMQWKSAVQAAKNPWQEWQKKNDWRAEGLLKFVGLRLPLPMIQIDTPIPPSKLLFDLPSCCYDMHTRVGLNVLQRLVRGVHGEEGIRDFFQENEIRNAAHRALGEVLFSVEGGRIQGELIYEPLCALEQRLFAHQFGLPFKKWGDLRVLVEKALLEGVIDRVREEVLRQHYSQEKLQLIAQEGTPDL